MVPVSKTSVFETPHPLVRQVQEQEVEVSISEDNCTKVRGRLLYSSGGGEESSANDDRLLATLSINEI